MQRRLAAVLSADVVGYSRLMDADEVGTLNRLTRLRENLIEPVVVRHGGRIVKFMGDGLLVEFASVVSALACALDWQNLIASAETVSDQASRMCFRIGISLGEIISQGEDIFGKGVNVSARLEALAEPGGICVSSEVQGQCLGRIEASFKDLGEVELKNLSGSHRIFSVTLPFGARLSPKEGGEPLVAKYQSIQQKTHQVHGKATSPPSLAVLPFFDLNPNNQNALLGDGMTEEVVAMLSKTRWLFLIAAQSSLTVREPSVDAKSIAEQMGVRYLLRGTFLALNNRIRVTAQLIDGGTGGNLDSFRFDHELDDPFQVIDDIAVAVVGRLLPGISLRERARMRRNTRSSFDTWEVYLRALDLIRQNEPDACRQAKLLLMQVTETLPDFAPAHARLATCILHEGYFGWSDQSKADIVSEAMKHAARAIDADIDEALACDALASTHQYAGNQIDAERWSHRAIELNPTCVAAYSTLITVLAMRGEAAEALKFYDQLRRVSPHDLDASGALMGACIAHFVSGDMKAASDAAREHSLLRPNWYGNLVFLAASLGHLGEREQALETIQKTLKILPGHTLSAHREQTLLKRPEDVELLIEGLRLAGLPE